MSTVVANGIEIYYEVTGSGPPLTLIMGMGCSARQWQWMAPVLAESFQVIAFDTRGVGRSSKPDIEYTTGLFADDICGLLDVLQVEKTHLFGASVGGMIAQRFALKYPARLDRLVLGCTMPNFQSLPPAPEDLETMMESQQLSLEDGVEKMLGLFLSPQFKTAHPDQTARLKELMVLETAERGMDAFFNQLGAAMNHDTREEAAQIAAPTLLVCGDKDRVAPVVNSRFLAGQIPGSTLTELPGGYHAFWVERAEEACGIINTFLSVS
ncbi:MAG: alpha/beta fold hydrolase [Deltaproteobacteria bacterium]|nr:alpha/beta fold hydrolase [Deltaproteobacteria bacterium]